MALATAIYLIATTKRDFWDFEVFRTAGVRVLGAEPLYRAEDDHYVFKYWPAFAFAVTPFALISAEAGKVLWFGGSIACLVGLIAISVHALPDRRRSAQALRWLTALFVGKFIVVEVVNGQTNSMLGLLAVLSVWLTQRESPKTAGALVGLAVFVKPYALLLLPWIAWASGARALAAAACVLIAGLLLPVSVYGWSGNLELLKAWYGIVTASTPENLLLAENISFASLWAKWVGPFAPAAWLALLTTVACLVAVGFVWWRRATVARPSYLEAGLLLLLMPLISPQGWDYVLLIAAPVYACLLDRFSLLPPPWRVVAALGMALTSFTIYDLVGRSAYQALTNAGAPAVGGILLFASAVHLRSRGLA
jgi:hypothetical protein